MVIGLSQNVLHTVIHNYPTHRYEYIYIYICVCVCVCVTNNLHDSFHGIGVSTTGYSEGRVHGHPPGGVTILWDNIFNKSVRPLVIILE